MKTTIVLVFSILVISISLPGQTNRSKYKFGDIKLDTTLSIVDSKNPQINNYFNVDKKTDLFSGEKSGQIFDLNQNHSPQYPLTKRRNQDSETEEKFPGSSRFYGNPFHIKPDTTGNLFFKKPDMSKKYYLVIIDPIHNTIVK